MDKQKIFTTIKSFVSEINNTYGSQYKHLALYGRLIEKTNMTHEIPVSKHIAAFKKFAVANREAIVSKDASQFKIQKIKYSENVCFNIVNIFKLAENDQDATDTIWEHLLVISAMLDSKSNAKKKLMSDASASASTSAPGGDMSQMLLPLMNMFTNSMMNDSSAPASGEGAANPLAALLGGLTPPSPGTAGGAAGAPNNNIFGNIMNSGILPKMMNTFTECVGENNQIDFKKLLDSVQDMVKDMNVDIPTGADPKSKQDIDSLLGAFENVGLSKDTMKSVVDNIVTDLQKGGGLPSASEETTPVVETVESCTTLVDTGLVDLTEPVVPSEDVQVCYIGGGGCCSVPQ